MTVLLVLLTIVFFLTADFVIQRLRAKRVGQAVLDRVTSMVESFRQIPAGIELALNHMWVKQEAGSVVTIGLDEFIAKFFGTVDRIVLPEAGTAAQSILLQDGTRSLAMACPVGGRVVAVNPDVLRDPGSAYADPYGTGWLFKVQLDQNAGPRTLAGGQASEWLKEQVSAARQFFLGRAGGEHYALMQDGGILVDGVMKMYDHKVWEEFSERFLTQAPVSTQATTK